MIRKAQLEEALEEADSAVWYFRSHPDEPVAQDAQRKIEAKYPELAREIRQAALAGNWSTYHRWCGRLATLRWMLANDGHTWDDGNAGRFDT